MRFCAILTLGLLSISAAIGQTSVAEGLLSNPYESVCGKPLADGKVYDFREGKVTKLAPGNRLVFEQVSLNGDDRKANYLIQLAGINTKENEAALAKLLAKSVVGKDVIAAGNLKEPSDTSLYASIWLSGLGDLNQHLLKNGIAKFAEPEYKSVSAYTLCVSRQTAEEAKSKRVGVWADQK